MDKGTLRLRAHHGLCIRYFTGHGYSEDFVRNMYSVIERLNAGCDVRIVSGPDDLCAHCPNLADGLCTSQDKVLDYDSKSLSACSLSEGMTVSWKKWQSLIDEKIMEAGLFDKICGDCQWKDLCHKD